MEVDWDEIEDRIAGAPADYHEGHFKYPSIIPNDVTENETTQVPDDITENKTTQVPDSLSPILAQNVPKIQNPDAIEHHKVNEVEKD